MNDLAEFLLARIAEDEVAARAATPSPWVPGSQGWIDATGRDIIVAPYHDLDISDEDAEHVTHWQPARVLAECEAKWRIVVRCDEMLTAAVPMAAHLATWTLADLALPYADHADYREEWKP